MLPRRQEHVIVVIVWAALASMAAACSGGGASRGEHCDTVADCADDLQCLDHICKPKCLASVECGDGAVCSSGSCVTVHSAPGDPCDAELDCGPGQTCRLPETLATSAGFCELETVAAPTGADCSRDADCRSGACALGRCTELCARADQCRVRNQCAAIPRVTPDARVLLGSFKGCLPSVGNLTFEIPFASDETSVQIKIPVPSTATSMTLVAEIGGAQLIGATHVVTPTGDDVYDLPDTPKEYYEQLLRHHPLPSVAVLSIPTTSAVPLEAGAYTVDIGTFLPDGAQATSRRLRVIEKLGTAATLDVHFYFLDLADHPCAPATEALNAASAPTDPGFQNQFLDGLRAIFRTDIALGTITYQDVEAPELDGLTAARAGDLFKRSQATTGISVFFVRSLSPAGLEVAIGGTPGAPLPGTRASGIAVAATSLCYGDWSYLARQTAHAMARHMGLYRNIEPTGESDPLADSMPDDHNLMFWTGTGVALSTGQRAILRASPVLR